MKKINTAASVLLAILLFQFRVNSQPFTLLKDINTNTSSNGGNSNPSNFINFNGTLYFTASDMNSPLFPVGNEIFKTDGTTAGTGIMADIGQNASGNPGNFTIFNGLLYFTVNDNIHGYELWKTGGTAATTELVKDINTTETTSNISNLTVVNNTLFFSATNGAANNGQELWKTDGTAAGTVMVKDIYPGTQSGNPMHLTNVNGVLYFSAASNIPMSAGVPHLWKSDGTEAGTVLVNWHYRSGHLYSLIDLNGTLLYTYSTMPNGLELWKSDGTWGGSRIVKDITPELYTSSGVSSLTLFNNHVYFTAVDGINGRELWKSDGFNSGTVMVKNINTHAVPGAPSGSPNNLGSDPTSLMVHNGLLYFSASNPDDGLVELYKTDGTEAGTVKVKDINPTGSSNPVMLGRSGFKIYFAANDGVHGNELWSSDGTPEGTVMVQDIEPGPGSSNPTGFIEVAGKMYVSVETAGTGRELLVANAPANGPLPLSLLEFKGSIAGDDGLLQWKTDNELNTKSFAVERSTNGRNYSVVGNVTAANASGIHYYNYTDVNIKSLGASTVYYRLRQNDVDNKHSYSRIVALTMDKERSFAMLYPNPVRKDLNLTITLPKKDRLNWQITDNNGRVIKNGYYDLGVGSTSVIIDGSSLGAGNYFLRLNGEMLQQTIKIVKQ
jgi:trimeric autotransporter adhesin